MKAVTLNVDGGRTEVADVPAPQLQPGGVLVRVHRSLVSIGTERAAIKMSKGGPLAMARARPDLARKVLNKAKQEGYWGTYKVVRNLIKSPMPLGYSCAGVIEEVGGEAGDLRVGERVACAGLGFANHAEIDYIPRNLVARVPENVSFDDASFVTIGAIVMQGVRLARLELGETVVVLGLGLLGQTATQIARASGAVVVASDPDPARVQLALELGAHHGDHDTSRLREIVQSLTGGHGADAVLICAATKSDGPIRQAAELSRLKGRVVVVGDVGLGIERRPYFEKELDLVISRSYGPGRYDPQYEVHGVDYPLPYVRWTEQRNMQSFLDLVARGAVRPGPLVTHRFPIDRAEEAYRIVGGEDQQPAIAIVLEYPERELPRRIDLGTAKRKPREGAVRLGVIGAGQFAKGVLLPAFRAQSGVAFRGFCTASGVTSRNVAENFGADYCTSDAQELIADPDVDAVVIATRHDEHARLAAAALRAGKAVFVEKPLALTPAELDDILAAALESGSPLMVGFNRRFAPLMVECRDFFHGRAGPLFATYRVNAGQFPAEHWVHDPRLGGGRIIGEGCHFVDALCFLTDSLPVRVHAETFGAAGAVPRDSATITLRMSDGSVGTIHYLAEGDASVSKEYLEVYGGGRTAILDNYRTLALHRGNKRRMRRLMNQAKGHTEEVAAFVRAVRDGTPMPIGLDTLVAVTRATFAVHRSLDTGAPAEVEGA